MFSCSFTIFPFEEFVMRMNQHLFVRALDQKFIAAGIFAEMAALLKKAKSNKEEMQIADTYIPNFSKATKEMSQALEAWHASLHGELPRPVEKPSVISEQVRRRFEHPERKEGEVFYILCTALGRSARFPDTAREGQAFHDGLGDRVNDSTVFPIFIEIREALTLGAISPLDVIAALQCGLIKNTEVAALISAR